MGTALASVPVMVNGHIGRSRTGLPMNCLPACVLVLSEWTRQGSGPLNSALWPMVRVETIDCREGTNKN